MDNGLDLINNLLEAIDTIATQRANEVSFDRTIVCTIVNNVNAYKAEYVVSDGSSQFYAYSDNLSYQVDDKVLVLIPEGDFSNTTKYIITKVYNKLDYEGLHQIFFNADGGSVAAETKIVKRGKSYGILPTPYRSGYTFEGWYTELGERVSSTDIFNEKADLVLVAKWSDGIIIEDENPDDSGNEEPEQPGEEDVDPEWNDSNACDSWYKGNDHFEIQYFYGPTAEMISEQLELAEYIANAGFTVIPMMTDFTSYWSYTNAAGQQKMKDALKALRNNFIKVYLTLGSGDATHSSIRPLIEIRNVIGLDFGDEPIELQDTNHLSNNVAIGYFSKFLMTKNVIEKDFDIYLNLLPSYVTQNTYYGNGSTNYLSDGDYDDYLETYLQYDDMKFLSVDYYFDYDKYAAGSVDRDADLNRYVDEMAKLYVKAKQHNKKFLNIISTVSPNTVSEDEWKKRIYHQIGMNFSFGVRRLSYFTFMTPVNDNSFNNKNIGILNSDGTIQRQRYDFLANLNNDIYNIGNLLYHKQLWYTALKNGSELKAYIDYEENSNLIRNNISTLAHNRVVNDGIFSIKDSTKKTYNTEGALISNYGNLLFIYNLDCAKDIVVNYGPDDTKVYYIYDIINKSVVNSRNLYIEFTEGNLSELNSSRYFTIIDMCKYEISASDNNKYTFQIKLPPGGFCLVSASEEAFEI